jgi:hypothetical protein
MPSFTTYPTITAVTITTSTIVPLQPPHAPVQHQPPNLHVILQFSWLQQILLLSIPLLWLLALLRKSHLHVHKKAEHDAQQHWEEPWLTKDWEALYGLIRLTYDHKWLYTPFWLGRSVQEHWHMSNRPWLRRLLGMGVIPLFIQDGGMNTHRVNFTGCGWTTRFPWVKVPIYQQGKRRAYFEFLVPFPYASKEMATFLESIILNRMGEDVGDARSGRNNSYGVTIRFGPLDRGRVYYAEDNPPVPEDRPLEVGAQCVLKPLLPLKRDGVLKRGYGDHANRLAYFIRNNQPEKIPLLRYADTVLVRLEAQHYGACELDAFLFGLAQAAGLEVQWPEGPCEVAALQELQRCELPTEELHLARPVRIR